MFVTRLLLLAFLAMPVMAQTDTPGKPNVVTWNPSDAAHCLLVYSNGLAHEVISDRGRSIDVFAPTLANKHTYRVSVGIQNLAGGVIDVDPEKMGGVTDDATPIVMPSIDADARLAKEVQSARRRAMIGAALSGYAAGSSSTTATIHNSDGTTSTATIHDNTATQQANTQAAANRASIDSRASAVSSTILRRNSVYPGNFATGFVYMDKPKGMGKKAHVAQFVVDLGETIYVFPFVNGAVPE